MPRTTACWISPTFTIPSKSVSQAVKDAEGKVGGPVKLTGFVRFALGEGIEKKEEDFAAEVAAAVGATELRQTQSERASRGARSGESPPCAR